MNKPEAEDNPITSRIAIAGRLSESTCYPFAEDGLPCPYLDDADRLYTLLQLSSHRPTFKKFCKNREWLGKPRAPHVMTDAALKQLLHSAYRSADARHAMSEFSLDIAPYRIVYNAVSAQSPNIHHACLKLLNSDNNSEKPSCITPDMLDEVIKTHRGDVQQHDSLHLLALSLAMRTVEQAADYVGILLYYFPNSTASMCGTDLSMGPAALSCNIKTSNSTEKNAPSATSCTLARVGGLHQKLGLLSSAFDKYRGAADQICSARELGDFADARGIEALANTLITQTETIASTAGKIKEILETAFQCPDGHGCALCQELLQFQKKPSGLITNIILTASRATSAADSVTDECQLVRTKLESLASVATTYINQLGRSDNDCLNSSAVEFPCLASRALVDMQGRVDQLKGEVDSKVAEARTELLTRLDALAEPASADTASHADSLNQQIKLIRRSVRVANDMHSMSSLCSQIRDIEATLFVEPSALNLTHLLDAASQLKSIPGDMAAFLHLCEILISRRLYDVALLVLETRQQLYPADEIVIEPDRAIDTLLKAICKAGDATRNFAQIWKSACVSPWLLAIRRSDLASTELIACLAVLYVAEAISGSLEHSSNGLLNLCMGDRGDIALTPTIEELIEAIVSHRTFRVVTEVASSRVDELRCEIEECVAFESGKYRHIQCGKATHFARFEAINVFPELVRFWREVSTAISRQRLADASRIVLTTDANVWIEQMYKSHDREILPHPHFSTKILTFVSNYVALVRDYVAKCEELAKHVDTVVYAEPLKQDLAEWAGSSPLRKLVAKCFSEQILITGAKCGGCGGFLESLFSSREVITLCPTATAWYISHRCVRPVHSLESLIIDDLAKAYSLDEINDLLFPHRGWVHLTILWKSQSKDRASEYGRLATAERLELQARRKELSDFFDSSLGDEFDGYCNAGQFVAAREILDECEERFAKAAAEREEEATNRVSAALQKLNAIKDSSEDQGMSGDWVEKVYAQSSVIERALKKLQRSIIKSEPINYERLPHLEKSLQALTIVVRERSSTFDVVKFHLGNGRVDAIAPHMLEATENDAYLRCPELMGAWAALRTSESDRARAAWVSFAKLFGKLCNLYHDENDPNGRFTPVIPFEYPYGIYQTGFYKPKSEFLKRPLRLYLYRDDVDNQARQRLDTELSEDSSAAWLHVVFAPKGADRLRKSLQLDRKFRSVLVIDDAFLFRICAEEKHDVPIRQGLHGVVADLVSSSPFVANGYCHQENNIYVGRSDVIQRLLNNPQAMIWGGRRIGKTSVLHALEATLFRRHFRVALLYADVHDSVDPDLAIAQRLADTLGISPVKSVSDFVKKIKQEQNKGSKFAFLLDEVDEYIKKSRLAHDGKFPLASGLRQIVMEDPTKSTVLVYSGYHQLYFEAKLSKSSKRVGHPFVNIASDFPIRDLSHDEVVELVRTGFEDMLGIDLCPEVPSLIAERASRHPAFVQEFCRCMLSHVSRRRTHPQAKIIISSKDVDEVYKADGRGDGGEQPFIFYVDETLGYNLSYLGRAIMLSIESEGYVQRSKIREALNLYAELAGIEAPREEHFSDTIDLLVMTNLLTQDPRRIDFYRITYPTFIDILRRLNKLGKTEIEKSLRRYDQNERSSGVLR